MKKSTTDYSKKEIVDRYTKGPVTRQYVDIPESIRLIGDVKGKRVLDLGCGQGAFTKTLFDLGAKSVGIDLSETFISEAKKSHPGITFFAMNAANMSSFSDNYFDKIIMRMVLVNIDDEKTFAAVFKECSRVLKSEGELIFSIHHPLIIQNFHDSIREVILPPNGGYAEKKMHYKLKLLFTDGAMFEFDCCHWPIDALVKELVKNNFSIVDMTSPVIPPEKPVPSFADDLRIRPHHMFFKCLKTGLPNTSSEAHKKKDEEDDKIIVGKKEL